jgi:hypothetical protein
MNALQALAQCGQSVWLDYLKRSLITDGGLKALIDRDGVNGVTSNPSFSKRPLSPSRRGLHGGSGGLEVRGW